MVLLKKLFQQKMEPKYYVKTHLGTYRVKKDETYYCTCHTEEEAKLIVSKLKKVNWDKTMIPMIKKEVGWCKEHKINTIGFYRVYINSRPDLKRGFRYIYQIQNNGKKTTITSKSLKDLRKKVINANLLWKPLTDDAKKIDEILKEEN